MLKTSALAWRNPPRRFFRPIVPVVTLLLALLAGAAVATPVPAAPELPQAGGPELPQAGGPEAVAPAPPSGLVTIESDRQLADNATGIITASGNVRILYPDRRLVATSRQAQYFTREGRILLSGDVDVVQEGGNRLRADRVVYLVETERVLAQPQEGEQVFSQLRLQTQTPAPATSPTPSRQP